MNYVYVFVVGKIGRMKSMLLVKIDDSNGMFLPKMVSLMFKFSGYSTSIHAFLVWKSPSGDITV